MSDKIRERIWDISLVLKDIKEMPQTYNTILKELSNDGTCQIILRRKLNKLLKYGNVFKTTIPGTRFGKVIYYSMPKNYHILVEASRLGSNVFCFYEYEKISKFYIKVCLYYNLEGYKWIKYKKIKTFFQGDVLKWI